MREYTNVRSKKEVQYLRLIAEELNVHMISCGNIFFETNLGMDAYKFKLVQRAN